MWIVDRCIIHSILQLKMILEIISGIIANTLSHLILHLSRKPALNSNSWLNRFSILWHHGNGHCAVQSIIIKTNGLTYCFDFRNVSCERYFWFIAFVHFKKSITVAFVHLFVSNIRRTLMVLKAMQ